MSSGGRQEDMLGAQQDWNCDTDGANWFFEHSETQTKVVALRHENGLEIDILSGVISSIMATAILGLVNLAWKRWKQARKSLQKTEPSLVIERVTERFPDGRIRHVDRFERRGPLDDEVVKEMFQQVIGKSTD